MAVLTQEEADWVSRKMATDGVGTGNVTRATFKAALQVIEDWYEGDKATVSSAIDTATSPVTFSNAVKKQILRYWVLQKFNRESV